MDTPKAADKRDSSDTPNTNITSTFSSDNSPLSSPTSSVLGCSEEGGSEPRNTTQGFSDWDILDNYGTAASQREHRASASRRAPIMTSDTTPSKLAIAECDQRPARHLKRKQQATAVDTTPEPQQKKLQTPPSSRTLRSGGDYEPTFELGPQLPTPPRPWQLRKRKLVEATTKTLRPPPSKKPKASPSQTSTKPKRKSARIAERGPRAPVTSKKQTQPNVATVEALAQPPPEASPEAPGFGTLIVRIKMPADTPSWFSRGGTPAPNTHRTTSPTQTDPKFESPSKHGNQLSVNEEGQCAQVVPVPVLASSQGTSTESYPHSYPSPELQKVTPKECHTSTSPAESFALPCPSNENADIANLPLQPQIVVDPVENNQHELPAASSYQTQPTQAPSQPLDFLRYEICPTTEPSGTAASYVDSDAKTEQEEPFVSPHSISPSQQQIRLCQIAKQLFANRTPGLKKPAPSGQPEVWAEGRQELCETLHYYRAYQSGCYSTGGFARGFMFDKVAHERDYIDSHVVISRAGGGLVKDNDSGKMKSGRDQADQSPVITALKNCMTHCNPVVILVGADNPHIPSQPPHQYCVLDYFKPTHIWVEKSGKGKIVRYRFEKLNTQKKSWWDPENDENQVELGSLDSPVEKMCTCCGELSVQVYLNGWMCLQPTCIAFWHIAEDLGPASHNLSKEPVEADLIYDPRFLKQKTPWVNDNFEYSLKFDGPQVSEHGVPGEDTSQSFSSGIVCPECGRCNSRIAWAGWECSTSNCNFRRLPAHSFVPAKSLHERFWPLSNSYTMSRDTHASMIELSISFAHGYRINRYQIPGLDGSITHMIANKTVIEEEGGPNTMFEELQKIDIDLRRRVMPNGQLKGDTYCCHFSVNYGMPYKFIAATASHSFDGAARPINATRSRLNWATKYLAAQEMARHGLAQQTNRSLEQVQCVKNYHGVLAAKTKEVLKEDKHAEEFNEVLALGYFESQKMNYHDDGEFGLGPTIATLSLGAPGTMRIRMKDRHYHGASATGLYDDARPVPGCSQYEARLALQPQLDALKASDPRAYNARRKQIPKDLKLKHSGHAKDVLKMELGHGDIVVMHGAELQKYYEHSVDHVGKLRFALTCRYIDPESLKEADKPDYEVGPDLGGYDGAKLC